MMAQADRERWDRKYAAGQGPAHFRPRPFLEQKQHLLSQGRALDIACGFGGNALFLSSVGYQVDAVDISGVALTQARAEAVQRGLHINLVQADLARWWIPPGTYNLSVVFFYLNRSLMPRLAAGLQPGGLLFQANRNQGFLAIRPDFDPNYLLEPGELRRLALDAGLEVLHYDECMAEEPYVSHLIARQPAWSLGGEHKKGIG